MFIGIDLGTANSAVAAWQRTLMQGRDAGRIDG